MIKMAAILPFEELGNDTRRIFEEHNQTLYGQMPENEEYELEVIICNHKTEELKIDADVIITRGMIAYELRNVYFVIPVIEIPISSGDIVRSLWKLIENDKNLSIAAIGSTNMVMGVENLQDIFGIRIKSFIVESHEYIEETVNKVVAEGFKNVLGGLSACHYAQELGCRVSLLTSGPESIWHAISEAKRAAYISKLEREKALKLKTILDHAYEGIVATDTSGMITVFNDAARKTMGLSNKEPVGKKLKEFVSERQFTSLFDNESEQLDKIIKFKNSSLIYNKIPVHFRNQNIGHVVTFQDITKVQATENLIRKSIYIKGHVAKSTFEDIVGKSIIIRDIIEKAKRYSNLNSNLLIIGETGTGKEIFAQSIHNYSNRKEGPFIAVNCAAIPPNLMESELFGYVEGAFTGAIRAGKAGYFELAHGGTIFLDEISEIPYELQGRLLRVIQEREVVRLGSDKVIPVDVRIISASNKELEDLVRENRFREDLYYRIDVLRLVLPPLADRKEDIPLIVDSIMKKNMNISDKTNVFFTDFAMETMKEQEWPGNIRQLINICERILALSTNNIIGQENVYTAINRGFNSDRSKHNYSSVEKPKGLQTIDLVFQEREKEKIITTLEAVNGNREEAAKRLGIGRTTLWRKIKKYHL